MDISVLSLLECYGAGVSHDIAFDMYHVGCKGIPHDHVVCFWPCGIPV